MKEKRYLLSLITAYMCYFTHGIQSIILAQNSVNFYTQWGYTDPIAGAQAVSLAITATGFGKFLTVWVGGMVSDRIGRKKMAVGGSILYIICFAGLLFTKSFMVASICAFLAGVATSGFWDAAFYPAVQEAVPKYSSSALIGIKAFISISGIFYPLLVVYFASIGKWHINIWIPLILSIVCLVFSLVSKYPYDEQMKKSINSVKGNNVNAVQAEIDAIKSKMLVEPNKLVNFFTAFYGFITMFIMYGAQQYTKAFGMSNAGLTEIQAAGLTSIYTVGSIIAVVFWAFAMGKLRWNPLKVLLIDFIFTAAALAIVLLVRNVAVIYLAIALLGFFAAGGSIQTGLAVRQELNPGPKGTNTGVYYTWLGFASISLPFTVSYMTKSIGEQAAVYTMMGLLLITSIVATIMTIYLVFQYKRIFGKNPLSEEKI